MIKGNERLSVYHVATHQRYYALVHGLEEGRNVSAANPSWRKGINPVARWKKSGDSCPLCDQETEVLVGVTGDYDGVCSAEGCWMCGWVAELDKEKGLNKTKESLSERGRGLPKQWPKILN